MRNIYSKFDSIPDDGTAIYGVSEDALNQYGQIFNGIANGGGYPTADATLVTMVECAVGTTTNYDAITSTFEVPEDCIGVAPIEFQNMTVKTIGGVLVRSTSGMKELDLSKCFLVNNYPNVFIFSPEITSADKGRPAMVMCEVETDDALLLAHQVQVAPNTYELKVEWDVNIMRQMKDMQTKLNSLETRLKALES